MLLLSIFLSHDWHCMRNWLPGVLYHQGCSQDLLVFINQYSRFLWMVTKDWLKFRQLRQRLWVLDIDIFQMSHRLKNTDTHTQSITLFLFFTHPCGTCKGTTNFGVIFHCYCVDFTHFRWNIHHFIGCTKPASQNSAPRFAMMVLVYMNIWFLVHKSK